MAGGRSCELVPLALTNGNYRMSVDPWVYLPSKVFDSCNALPSPPPPSGPNPPRTQRMWTPTLSRRPIVHVVLVIYKYIHKPQIDEEVPEMHALQVDPYFITQDNGAGAPIHFAVTYRQLDMVGVG